VFQLSAGYIANNTFLQILTLESTDVYGIHYNVKFGHVKRGKQLLNCKSAYVHLQFAYIVFVFFLVLFSCIFVFFFFLTKNKSLNNDNIKFHKNFFFK
jgi:hypothetical protein